MDSLDVQRQLRCAGMLESIRIRRATWSAFFLRNLDGACSCHWAEGQLELMGERTRVVLKWELANIKNEQCRLSLYVLEYVFMTL